MSWFKWPKRLRTNRPYDHPDNQRLIRSIQETAARLGPLPNSHLKAEVDRLREQVFQGESPSEESIVVPGFALMNEAIRRTLGFQYYAVQLFAGFVLAQRQIAEMQTGEGKTLVAALPALVHSLKGRGVHISTANHYLARRDFDQLAPAFEILGITVQLLPEPSDFAQKKHAYQSAITYGTGYEFGFDHLRDQVTLRRRGKLPLGQNVFDRFRGIEDETQFLQRGLRFALIDEVDSVLIDDGNSPLVLSEPSPQRAEDAPAFKLARDYAEQLEQNRDYQLDHWSNAAEFSEDGLKRIHVHLDQVPFHLLKRPWTEYIRQALRAQHYYRRNVHYIVNGDSVQLVDESTGRVFQNRHWRDGLHQAIEAKEGLPITSEKKAVAQVTRQRFYRLYESLCGMTGTAAGSEREFSTFYNLAVVPIPLHRPSRRIVLPPRYFADAEAKWTAVTGAIQERRRSGQPVLVGTRTISSSEVLSERLKQAGIDHQLLNGCQSEKEAEIISRAGEWGTVTIATNMAGRGTDIKLDSRSLNAGGLHVIGTERHHASRVDRQLIGRCARQGDPGSAQFFFSAEDGLIAAFHPRLAQLMKKSANAAGEVTLAIDSSLARLQRQVEWNHFRQRYDLFRRDQNRETVLSSLHGHK